MLSGWMDQMFKTISDLGRSYLEFPNKKYSVKSMNQLCQALLQRKGEASGTALAKDVVDSFHRMNSKEKLTFLEMLTTEFGPDTAIINEAAKHYLQAQDFGSLQKLTKALESPRMDLIRMINFAPGGIAAIIKMRELVLKDLKGRKTLLPLEADLFHLLSAWFNRGFLDFQQINWNTPAVILEKIIAYEAVHEITSWRDLRRRLASDRSCFAFFHPALHHEPLIFVQVAFTKGIARKIQPLLNQDETDISNTLPDTAIFYSISNAQAGLKGISFGNFLIKQVVDHISKALPSIKTYSTLSPIPKFRYWLDKYYKHRSDSELTESERALLSGAEWYKNAETRKQLKKTLIRICARYLVFEKKGILPYDPVTRFHLGNGAEIENINWEADLSDHGLELSAGLMVNYRYTPAHIVENHEAYINEGRICHSSKVKKALE